MDGELGLTNNETVIKVLQATNPYSCQAHIRVSMPGRKGSY